MVKIFCLYLPKVNKDKNPTQNTICLSSSLFHRFDFNIKMRVE